VIYFDGALTSKGKFIKLSYKTCEPESERGRIAEALTSSINTNSYASVTRNLNPVKGGDNQNNANTMSKSTGDEGEGTGTNDKTEYVDDDDDDDDDDNDDDNDDDKIITSIDSCDIKDTGKKKKLAKTGSHAMVVIGGRAGKKNTTWYLCLNSWEGMPLVELSETYIKSAEALLHFCTNETGELGSSDKIDGYYDVNALLITQCSNIQC
jgi:hypothetical protein